MKSGKLAAALAFLPFVAAAHDIVVAADHTTPKSGVNLTGEPFFEKGHGVKIESRNLTTGEVFR